VNSRAPALPQSLPNEKTSILFCEAQKKMTSFCCGGRPRLSGPHMEEGMADEAPRSNSNLARATNRDAYLARIGAHGRHGEPMASALKFGRKLNVPSVIQIKHQLLVLWLKDQTAKEAAEASVRDAKLLIPGSLATSLNIDKP
jgi:hypothetical protein